MNALLPTLLPAIPRRGQVLPAVVACSLLASPALVPLAAEEEAAVVERRLEAATSFLASDELEGRGVGTRGHDAAAEYVAKQFRELGLQTALVDGQPYQKFSVTYGARLGPHNEFALLGPPAEGGGPPQRIELKRGTEFNPLAIGGSGRFRLPLVFAGYGITGRQEKYDDYADVDVRGKGVILLRHEPQQSNPHSAFDGTDNSRHAAFRAKVSNAFQHGAAAVIFCTDRVEIERRVRQARKRWRASLDALAKATAELPDDAPDSLEEVARERKLVAKLLADANRFARRVEEELDPVLAFERAGTNNDGREMPVVHCNRAVLDRVLTDALGKDLATLEREIDEGPTPRSVELPGWQAVGQIEIERDMAEVKNVVAVLEGEGPRSDETIVIGAHYDHLGKGGPGSASPGSKEIHNGADDNASGTAVLVEVARTLAARPGKLPRRIVFIAFTGEERGLLGSAHYVAHPLFPLEKTVAMLNMDMVGRLQENKLIASGAGTAEEFSAWLDEINERQRFELIKKPGGFGPSDHASFYPKQIPVIHFFTGTHPDYHKPSDDVEKLDVPGMRRIGEMVAAMAVRVAEAPQPPKYVETKQPVARRGGDRPYFGSMPDFSFQGKGYALSGVAKGSPAERGGVRGGDVVIRFGDSKIGNLEDIDSALRKFEAGDKVKVVVQRGEKEVTLEVVLDPPK